MNTEQVKNIAFPYKEFIAIVTRDGTGSHPCTLTVLKNTLGVTFSITFVSENQDLITLSANVLTLGKTYSHYSDIFQPVNAVKQTAINEIGLSTSSFEDGFNGLLEIKVYP